MRNKQSAQNQTPQNRSTHSTIMLTNVALLILLFSAAQVLAVPPSASLSGPIPISGGIDTVLTFNASASTDLDGDATIARYLWDFGDGSQIVDSGIVSSQNHSYTATGTYTVTIAVLDDSGLADAAAITVAIGSCSLAGDRGNGEKLFNTINTAGKNCVDCHGVGGVGGSAANITVTGTDWTVISDVFENNTIPLMTDPYKIIGQPPIVFIDTDFQDIATYIACGPVGGAQPPPVDPGGPVDTGLPGQPLYEAYCLLCHGDGDPLKQLPLYTPLLDASRRPIDKKVLTEKIFAALGLKVSPTYPAVQDMINFMAKKSKTFSPTEIDQLVAFIAVGYTAGFPTAPPRPKDGPSLYIQFCSACHGPDALGEPTAPENGGNITGCDAVVIKNAIYNGDDSAVMAKLQALLTLEEIQLIGDWLVVLPPANGECTEN